MRVLFLFIVFVLNVYVVNAQNESSLFNVLHNGKKIGVLTAEKSGVDEKVLYTSHTEISYHLLVSIVVDYKYEVTYANNSLEKANVKIFLHHKERTNVNTVKMSNGYEFISDGKVEKQIQRININYSSELLLFQEPINIKEVYSEEHGDFHAMKKVEKGKYQKTDTNGHNSYYYYENGELVLAEIDAGIIEFSIERAK